MKDGLEVEKRSVYAAIKRRLAVLAVESIEDELRSISRSGLHYARFLDPRLEQNSEVQRSLLAFAELNVRTCYPLLLRMFASHDDGLTSIADVVWCLKLIESFVVRRFICDVPTNQLNKLFMQWSGEWSGPNAAEWLQKKMSGGTYNARWPSDDDFGEAFRTSRQYGGKATRYVLKSLELSYGHREEVNLSTATIEHIMPQELSSSWIHALGPDYEAVHGRLLHTFGNLTLTAYNSELGNLPFAKKRDRLTRSHIELNRWIADQAEWNGAVIENRASILAGKALQLWPGPTG